MKQCSNITLFLTFFYFLISWTPSFAQAKKSLEQTAFLLKNAISHYEEIKKTGDTSQLSAAALNIAAIYAKENLSSEALNYYHLSLSNLPKANQTDKDINDIHLKMVRALWAENQLDSVIFYNQHILIFYKQKQDYSGQLKTLQNLVKAYEKQDNLAEALMINLKILELTEREEDLQENAIALNNIGCMYNQLQGYKSAIAYLKVAEDLNEKKQALDEVILFTNLGVAHANIGNRVAAFLYFNKARKAAINSNQSLGQLNHLMASVYLQQKDWYNAEAFNEEAIKLAHRENDANLLSNSYALAAQIHQNLYEYEPALDYYRKYLSIRDSLLLKEKLLEQSLVQHRFLLEKAEKDIRLLLVNKEINTLALNRLELEKNNLKLEKDKYALETAKQEGELALLKQEQEIREANLKNQALAALQAQQQLRLTEQQLQAELKDRSIAELRQSEALQKMELAQNEAREKERLREIEILNQQKAISNLELQKQSAFMQSIYIAGVLGFLLLLLLLGGFIFARKSNSKLAFQKKQVEKSQAETQAEKAKSDALLLNILPVETAQELKETGAATPKEYEQVSVLFTDFCNFTQFAEQLTPDELIQELNACFVAFDEIIERNHLEKIKTIGDAYMCAGGIPKANKINAHDAVRAALEMQDFIKKHSEERQRKGLPFLKMRVGIHTGAVIAGVVGKNKFAYDIWGDTVNLAARMESSGEMGKVNISEVTYALVKNDFDCVFRGAIEAKHKGEVGMYFVVG